MITHIDPTRTTRLRTLFRSAIATRFNMFKRELQELLIKGDAFGLRKPKPIILLNQEEWRFLNDERRLEELKKWLKFKTGQLFLKHSTEDSAQSWLGAYIRKAYEQGLKRADNDFRKPTGIIGMKPEAGKAYQQGQLAEFMRQSLGGPVPLERVRSLATRTFNDLEGVTDQMATTISRTLLDGMVNGLSPRDIGWELNKVVDGYKNRGTAIARTEIIRGFNEGALDGLENLGAKAVGVMVEWSTSGMGITAKGNLSPCPKCAPLAGLVLTIEEARGLLPRHPNCVIGETKVWSPDPVAVMRSEYTGIIVELTTACGHSLSVTSHHILLTQRGWVFAKDLTDSDYLVHSSLPQLLSISPDQYYSHPMISQVFQSAVEVADKSRVSESLPVPKDLHGDGQFCDSKIKIVSTEGILGNEFKSRADRKIVEQFLSFGNITSIKSEFLKGFSSLSSLFKTTASAADSFMGSSGVTDVLIARHLRGSEDIRLDLLSRNNPSSNQHSIDSASSKTSSLCEFIRTTAGNVELSNFIRGGLTKISSINLRHVKALPVYDVSTISTLYIADGLLTSNCMCSLIPANVGEKTTGQIRDAERIRAAIARSARGDARWVGAKKKISTRRPQSV